MNKCLIVMSVSLLMSGCSSQKYAGLSHSAEHAPKIWINGSDRVTTPILLEASKEASKDAVQPVVSVQNDAVKLNAIKLSQAEGLAQPSVKEAAAASLETKEVVPVKTDTMNTVPVPAMPLASAIVSPQAVTAPTPHQVQNAHTKSKRSCGCRFRHSAATAS